MECDPRDIVKFFIKKKRFKPKVLVPEASMPYGIDEVPDHHFVSPTTYVLEAITTKNSREIFNLKSVETLGDPFLEYAASQQLFKTYQNQNQHEGLLSAKKEKNNF